MPSKARWTPGAGLVVLVGLLLSAVPLAASAACTYSVSPTFRWVSAAGSSSEKITVTAGSGCAWNSEGLHVWIHTQPGLCSGAGSGTLQYYVDANTSPSGRIGYLRIFYDGAGTYYDFPVYQPGSGCSAGITVSPASIALPTAAATTGTVTVTVPAGGCEWKVIESIAWLTVTSPAVGTSNWTSGTVSYSVDANPGGQRTGTMTVANRTITVTQPAGTCIYSISPQALQFGYAGGAGSVAVNASSGCSWAAASNATWITITSGTSGSGNGSVGYSVATNLGAARTGTMTIADQTFTVSQVAGQSCTFVLGSTGQSFSYVGGSGSVLVSTPTGCSWTAVSPVSWVTFTSGASGSGQAVVRYAVAANNLPGQRSATLTIAGKSYLVTQAGVPCTYSISPAAQTFGPAACTLGSVAVTSSNGACLWTATSKAAWITITLGASGNGNGTVKYSVAANTTGAQRVGTMVIAGRTFTVTQTVACTSAISPAKETYGPAAGTGTVSVAAGLGCKWATTTTTQWILITSGASGNGNGTLKYSVAANTTGATRTGTMTIAGKTFTVTQVASCTYSISPTSLSVSAAGTTSAKVTVTAPTGCAWTAKSNVAWVTITAGASGNRNGTVTYTVAKNTGAQRSGTMTIAGKTFTVLQLAP